MSRRQQTLVPAIVLDKEAGPSLHRQIYQQIAHGIRRGAIHDQALLPSTRVLAKLLGVSRNTVLAAYDDLAADGLVIGTRGSGMRVNGCAGPLEAGRFGLQQLIRAAGYPARVLALVDPDGNPLYLNF